MHEIYGQPLPNPLLAAKKHHSMDMETTPTLRQLYGSGSLSHTNNKSMMWSCVENSCLTTLTMGFGVTNSNCLAQFLIVNCNVVSPILNVNPTLFVILCKKIWGIIELQCCDYSHLPSDFHPSFNHPWQHFIKSWLLNGRWLFNTQHVSCSVNTTCFMFKYDIYNSTLGYFRWWSCVLVCNANIFPGVLMASVVCVDFSQLVDLCVTYARTS